MFLYGLVQPRLLLVESRLHPPWLLQYLPRVLLNLSSKVRQNLPANDKTVSCDNGLEDLVTVSGAFVNDSNVRGQLNALFDA